MSPPAGRTWPGPVPARTVRPKQPRMRVELLAWSDLAPAHPTTVTLCPNICRPIPALTFQHPDPRSLGFIAFALRRSCPTTATAWPRCSTSGARPGLTPPSRCGTAAVYSSLEAESLPPPARNPHPPSWGKALLARRASTCRMPCLQSLPPLSVHAPARLRARCTLPGGLSPTSLSWTPGSGAMRSQA